MQAKTATPHSAENPARRIRLATPALALTLIVAGCAAPADTAAPVGEHGAEGVGYGNPGHAAHVAMIDEIMMAPVREGQVAGASVAVVHQGEAVATRGYGWANLELRVPTPENAIYEMGSVTKQFTSAGLLQLQEQGLVDLDAGMDQYPARLPHARTPDHRARAARPHLGDPRIHRDGRGPALLRAPRPAGQPARAGRRPSLRFPHRRTRDLQQLRVLPWPA